jgi:hypothetical protein
MYRRTIAFTLAFATFELTAVGQDINEILASPTLTFEEFGVVKQIYKQHEKKAANYDAMHAKFKKLVDEAQSTHEELVELYKTTYVKESRPDTLKKAQDLFRQITNLTVSLNADLDHWAEFPLGREGQLSQAYLRKFKVTAAMVQEAWKSVKSLNLLPWHESFSRRQRVK